MARATNEAGPDPGPARLPDYPMVLHRGGFPDGSQVGAAGSPTVAR